VLEVLGFHNFKLQLASGAPGSIPTSSLAFDGTTVTWTQGGEQYSAST
jgi:hypothetical protein